MMRLMLDSGAYSAMSKGAVIDVDEYIAFIKEHEHLLECYVCLDVIGDPKASWETQLYMASKGITPVPVYHLNDNDLSYLKKMVDRFPYIGIGGMTGTEETGFSLSWEQVIEVLDKIWVDYICDSSGTPKVKVHGFGMTRPSIMRRYPWYSCDSTSWAIYSKFGIVLVPRTTNGEPDYKKEPLKIKVSSVSPGMKEEGEHIDNLSSFNRKYIVNYLHNIGYQLGKSEFKEVEPGYELEDNERFIGKGKQKVEIVVKEGVVNQGGLRDRVNFHYYMDFANTIPKWPWKFKRVRRRFDL